MKSKYDEVKAMLDDINIGIPASADCGDRMGLIILICYLTDALKQKKPGVTCYQVIRLCTKDDPTSDETAETLAAVCEWFSHGCKKFPNLGIQLKDMPAQIKQQIHNLLPF
jgi:hypothetical protein